MYMYMYYIYMYVFILYVHRYYEVVLLTGGMMRVGWATPSFPAGKALGTDKHSYGFDGFLVSHMIVT